MSLISKTNQKVKIRGGGYVEKKSLSKESKIKLEKNWCHYQTEHKHLFLDHSEMWVPYIFVYICMYKIFFFMSSCQPNFTIPFILSFVHILNKENKKLQCVTQKWNAERISTPKSCYSSFLFRVQSWQCKKTWWNMKEAKELKELALVVYGIYTFHKLVPWQIAISIAW